MNQNKQQVKMRLWKVAILDALLTGVILLVFALFHHALPAMITEYESKKSRDNFVQNAQPIQTDPKEAAEAETQIIESIEKDNRTEWQKKFHDRFSDEVIITDCSYSSPEVSITIDTIVLGERDDKITYYVADVYIASIDNFCTYTANGEMRVYGRQDLKEMLEVTNPVLAISGDSLTYQKSGFTMRNQEIYFDDHNRNSICVLFQDGSIEVFDGGTYDVEQIKEAGALQVWSFGPRLLDANGKRLESYNVSAGLKGVHPRCAIGYYEPGHYCFVVVDGRLWNHSVGMTVDELAAVFEELGCSAAYNLDGGGTAVMAFCGELFNRQSDPGRDLCDILFISDTFQSDIQEATE